MRSTMAGHRALAAVCWGVIGIAAVFAGAASALAEPAAKPPQQSSMPAPAMSNITPSKTPAAPQGASAKSTDAKLEPVSYASLPGWHGDDHLAAFKTFLKSCDAVVRAAARPAGKPASQCRVPVGELAAACRMAQDLKSPTKASARAFFERHFVPHRVAQAKPQGLLTGYYEPVLEGSRTRQGKFQTPIYKRPPDMVNVVDEADRASKPTGFTHLRKTSTGEEVPFPTRAEIEQGALAGKGLELLYLEDPVEVFFMHIQGSGRIHLTDGSVVRINYDGKNGYPYSSIGRYLIDSKMFPADKMSMQALGKWLREDKERGQKVMWQNRSFIFFRELDDSEGPMGAMSVPLTSGRSLAVDTGYHTLGTPMYLSVPELSRAAKDGGGFIRGYRQSRRPIPSQRLQLNRVPTSATAAAPGGGRPWMRGLIAGNVLLEHLDLRCLLAPARRRPAARGNRRRSAQELSAVERAATAGDGVRLRAGTAWAREHWQDAGIVSLRQIAERAGNEQLRTVFRALDDSCYAPGGRPPPNPGGIACAAPHPGGNSRRASARNPAACNRFIPDNHTHNYRASATQQPDPEGTDR